VELLCLYEWNATSYQSFQQQFASSQLSIWWLHSIYHYIHYVIVSRPRLFFQRHTSGHYGGFLCHNRVWGTETILVWNPFKTTVCLFSAFYLMITSYLPLHSLCYNLKTISILSETHKWALRWFQNRVWRTETILVWVAGKHDWIVDATMEEFNPSELQEENDFLQQFSSSLVTYLFIIILSMLSLLWDRLVIPRRSMLEFPLTQLYFMSAILA
jgi:hypothetical protein